MTRINWTNEDETWFQAIKQEPKLREIVSSAADSLGLISDDVLIKFLHTAEWQVLKAELLKARNEKN